MSQRIRAARTAMCLACFVLLILPQALVGQEFVAQDVAVQVKQVPASPKVPAKKTPKKKEARKPATAAAVTTASTAKTQKAASNQDLLNRLDKYLKQAARFKGEKSPAGPAKTASGLRMVVETPYFGGAQIYSNNQRQFKRFFAARLVLINSSSKPIRVTRDQIRLKVNEKWFKLEEVTGQEANSYRFRIKNTYHQLRTLKLLKEVVVAPGKSITEWVAFTGISSGSNIPELVLEVTAEKTPVVLSVSDYVLGMLDLSIERIGPRKALGMLTISGKLNSVNLGSLISALDRLTEEDVARIVIRWSKSSEVVDFQVLEWLKQVAALAGSGNSVNNNQMPIAPVSIRELHLAQLPKSSRSTGGSYAQTPFGSMQRADSTTRIHKTDLDAVSAALISAYRNLPADEVVREIESGHPLTRVVALAGGGGRLPAEKLPVLLNYTKHKDPRFQKASLTALGQYDRTEAVETLVAFTRHKNVELVRVATESLAASRYSKAHRALLEVLKSPASPSKKVIIGALARYPRPIWSETIYAIARDLDSETIVEALQTLARLGHPDLYELLKQAVRHENETVRKDSFKILVSQSDARSEQLALAETLDSLKDRAPTPEMRSLLSRTKDPRAIPLLMAHLDKNQEQLSKIVSLLTQIGDQSVAEVFVKKYPDLDTVTKAEVLNSLRDLKSPHFLKLAGESLQEKDSTLMRAACGALQKDGSPEAARMLAKAFEQTKASSAISTLGNALSYIATPEARAVLNTARESDNTQRQSAAVNALKNMQRRSPGYHYMTQGKSFAQQKQWDNALRLYSIAIQFDPDLSEAYSGRAVAYMNKGKSQDKAKADYFKGEQLDPYNSAAIAGLALILITEKKFESGIQKIEQNRHKFPKDRNYAFQTARLYGRMVWSVKTFQKNLSTEDRRKKIETYRKKSMEELRLAVKLGYNNYPWIRTAPDLESIRDMPEFKKLLPPEKPKPQEKTKPQKKAKPEKKKAPAKKEAAVEALEAPLAIPVPL